MSAPVGSTGERLSHAAPPAAALKGRASQRGEPGGEGVQPAEHSSHHGV